MRSTKWTARVKSSPRGTLHTKTIVKSFGRDAKEPVIEEAEEHFPSVKVKPGYEVAMIQSLDGVVMSANYQSVTVQVGGSMPWLVRPGNLKDFEKGMDAFDELIDRRMSERAKGLKKFLKEIKG